MYYYSIFIKICQIFRDLIKNFCNFYWECYTDNRVVSMKEVDKYIKSIYISQLFLYLKQIKKKIIWIWILYV